MQYISVPSILGTYAMMHFNQSFWIIPNIDIICFDTSVSKEFVINMSNFTNLCNFMLLLIYLFIPIIFGKFPLQ